MEILHSHVEFLLKLSDKMVETVETSWKLLTCIWNLEIQAQFSKSISNEILKVGGHGVPLQVTVPYLFEDLKVKLIK